MQAWEIEMVEKMSEQEQRKYYERAISKYKEEIKKLKIAKNDNNRSAIFSCAWRAGLIAAGMAVFAGPAMAALGEGAVKLAGEITSISAIGLFGGSIFGSVISNDDGPKDIKIGFEAAKAAKTQIKEIKKKIKNLEEKPVMSMR